ncbi:3-hydroxyacyl-CoA dehydrogenase family protein [Tumebacillus permanentifrigoris]|uniref:3-hydroxybutyryl-CoA dehydrogenase n=1 Tax=Tumebacillus permanentifrigoris TaxID=378543 RepID=A0A316DQC1_9BACL|nr:3-hydroxyacyl-CoA dehydrogenase family protein [Tumebacillus permanentifrigoris]PWK05411.1 3-hydroxybutyryl-CoA dehydrogenase [Tumebacillus permanentifrigoris]
MTSNGQKVLVLGDGTVAEELAEALKAAGYVVDDYLHPGPIDAWNEKPFAYLAVEFTRLEFAAYDAFFIALTSDRDVQGRLVRELELSIPKQTPLFVSAMSLAATEIASWCEHPERVIGFGFVPPLCGVQCLEMTVPLQAESTAFAEQAVASVLAEWGMDVEWVQDSAGLVLPRLVSVIVNEAVTALVEGVAAAEDIDIAMKLGTNYPHGPLAWADAIGLDQVYATLQGVYDEQQEDRYRPAPLLRRLVLAKRFGVRVGHGFYRYKGAETNA